jgi:hypothetical protein
MLLAKNWLLFLKVKINFFYPQMMYNLNMFKDKNFDIKKRIIIIAARFQLEASKKIQLKEF